MSRRVVFLSVPGLRVVDIGDPAVTPNLCRLANEGGWAPLRPSFPCVTSPVQANMLTGVRADRHGVIANGFYHRDRHEVALWMGANDVIEAPQLWHALGNRVPPITSAAWHGQNIKGAAATYIVTPAPIHQPDGSEKPWCYAKPEGLYEQLIEAVGEFPLHHYWGPMAGLPASEWIVRAAGWLIAQHGPGFNHVYVPHLDYAAQKAGPNSPAAVQALGEFDGLIGRFIEAVGEAAGGEETVWLIAGEYAMTEVRGALFPNRMLREAGLLKVGESDGGEVIDFASSSASAMVDHQFAHVFVQDASKVEAAAACFRDMPGIDAVLAGEDRSQLHMDHPRSGEIILTSRDDRWFAYYWWLADEAAPAFARTVDIHRKPGYDPVELFFDPATKSIPLDASLVKGSHGVPCTRPEHETVLVTSDAKLLGDGGSFRDTDVRDLVLKAFRQSK